MPETIFVNGRFCVAPLTGVQRYAREMLAALDTILSGSADAPAVVLLVPPRGVRDIPHFAHIETRVIGSLGGQTWEHAELPKVAGDQLLFSPANTGPLLARRHVVVVHDAATLDHPEWFSGPFAAWYRFLLPRLIRRAEHVITVSRSSQTRLATHAGVDPQRITPIPPGVSAAFRVMDDDTVAAARAALDLPARFLLAFGAADPRKNLPTLLDAYAGLDETTRPPLLIAGGTSGIFAQTQPALPPGARLLGRVDDDLLPALYTAAHAFLFPSLYEGFGLPVLEAMACGTPVLTADNTSLPEAAGDAALTVEATDASAIRAGIERVVHDDVLRTGLRAAGLARAQEFTWQRTAASVWDLLHFEISQFQNFKI